MPGVTIASFGPTAARIRRASSGDAITPVAAEIAGALRAREHEIRGIGAGREALVAQIGGVDAGHHGDGEDAELAALAARGFEHAAVVVDRHEVRGPAAQRAHRAGDGLGDVVAA